MSKWFPEMYDRPDNGPVAASAVYWVICYFMIPFVTLILSWAFSYDLSAVIGVDIGTYCLNFLCIISLFREYLSYSYENALFNKTCFVKAVLIAVVLTLLMEGGFLYYGTMRGWDGALSSYPISETSVVASTSAVVITNPLFGTLCMAVLAPVTVSCMFYATVFAPIANNRPKLAYIITALLLLLPRLLSSWWLQMGTYDLTIYLLQLPVHIINCWSYQKSNSIWAPILSLSITNLLVCLLLWFMSTQGLVYVK